MFLSLVHELEGNVELLTEEEIWENVEFLDLDIYNGSMSKY